MVKGVQNKKEGMCRLSARESPKKQLAVDVVDAVVPQTQNNNKKRCVVWEWRVYFAFLPVLSEPPVAFPSL